MTLLDITGFLFLGGGNAATYALAREAGFSVVASVGRAAIFPLLLGIEAARWTYERAGVKVTTVTLKEGESVTFSAVKKPFLHEDYERGL